MNCLFLAQGFPIYVFRSLDVSSEYEVYQLFRQLLREALYILKTLISHIILVGIQISRRKMFNYNISIEINKIQKVSVLKGCAKYTKRSLTNKNNKAVHCTIIRPNNNKATKGQLISKILFGVIIWIKNETNFFLEFLSYPLKRVQIKKL